MKTNTLHNGDVLELLATLPTIVFLSKMVFPGSMRHPEYHGVMTVGDLKKLLKNIDDHRLVVVAADEEGNAFLPLHQVEPCLYDVKQGEVADENSNLLNVGFSPTILLWPTHR